MTPQTDHPRRAERPATAPIMRPDFRTARIASSGLLSGTAVRTPWGPQFIECLVEGDLLTTADGAVTSVQRLRRRRLHNVPWLPTRLRPVQIHAGALGLALPTASLIVGGDQLVQMDGRMVPAALAVNETTIRFAPAAVVGKTFTYWQIATEAPVALEAEGIAVETIATSDMDTAPVPMPAGLGGALDYAA